MQQLLRVENIEIELIFDMCIVCFKIKLVNYKEWMEFVLFNYQGKVSFKKGSFL